MRVILVLLLLVVQYSFGQNSMSTPNHKFLLQQYVGEWINGDDLTSRVPSNDPNIKILVRSKMDGMSYVIEVFQKQNHNWITILSEIISYDRDTDQIVAMGSNPAGKNFIGKGGFSSHKKLIMKDHDFKGNFVQEVVFSFEDDGRLILRGDAPNDQNDWEGVYFKMRKENKNFGIHLVSVDSDMKKDPIGTIEKIGKMGYSYVETHRYENGKFYGFTPEEFRALLEKNKLRLEGSMVFKDLDVNNMDQTMKWWDTCISDQIKAGVQYITTTNVNIDLLKLTDGLKKYVSYFNEVGKRCKEKGILFLYHNHVEEFQKIRNEIIYDYFLKNTDPTLVYFQSDLYWMHVAKVDPIEYFKRFPGRFLSWHVKDIKELGSSNKIDFKEIFEYAKIAGLKYNTAEIEAYDYPPLISARMASDFMINNSFVKNYQ